MRMTKAVKKQMLAIVEAGVASIGASGIFNEETGQVEDADFNYIVVANEIINRLRLI